MKIKYTTTDFNLSRYLIAGGYNIIQLDEINGIQYYSFEQSPELLDYIRQYKGDIRLTDTEWRTLAIPYYVFNNYSEK